MHELPKLPYEYAALEPFIDGKTMEIHHGKHHAAYVAKLNEALEKYPDWRGKTAEELLRSLDSVPEDIRQAVRNHGGGHYNHSLFWTMMRPAGAPVPADADFFRAFGGADAFKEQFTKAALGVFGSGWAWLVKDAGGAYSVLATLNQDSPISKGFLPLLGLDVWEHAYYLKYQNKRAEYVSAWWNVVNWEQVMLYDKNRQEQ